MKAKLNISVHFHMGNYVNPIDPRRSEALGWPLPGRLEALAMVKRPERWRTLLDKLKLYTTYFYDILASN